MPALPTPVPDMPKELWTDDGIWHVLSRRTYSIHVFVGDSLDDIVTDAEVHIAGRRYGASFATPECLRDLLDRWAVTGEYASGSWLTIRDLVVVPGLTLENIARAVEGLFLEGDFWTAFDLLNEGEQDAEQ